MKEDLLEQIEALSPADCFRIQCDLPFSKAFPKRSLFLPETSFLLGEEAFEQVWD